MEEEQRLDDLIRGKLENYAPVPPGRVWERIAAGLESPGRVRRFRFVGWAAAAALLLAALLTGLLLRDAVEPETAPESAALAPRKTEAPLSDAPPAAEKGEIRLAAETAAAPGGKASAALLHRSFPAADAGTAVNAAPAAPAAGTLLREAVILASLPPRPALLSLKEEEKNRLIPAGLREVPSSPAIAAAKTSFSAVISPLAQKKEGKEDSWKIALLFQPAYSSYSAGYAGSYGGNAASAEAPLMASLGGGLSVQYRAARRWSVESGMNYSRATGQNSRAGGGATLYHLDATLQEGLKYYSSAVSLNQGELTMNSAAGVIRFSSTPPEASLITSPNGFYGTNTAMFSPSEFTQAFDFMEIPLTVRYRLLDRSVGVELLSGIATNVLFGNHVYMGNPAERQKVGSTRDISTFSFSGLAGLAISAPVAGHFSLSLEPRAIYSLNSINHGGEVDFRPWRIALFSGISYQF